MQPKQQRESFGGRIPTGPTVGGRIPRRKSALAREPPRKSAGKSEPPARHCDIVRTINLFLQQKCKVTPFPAKGSLDLKQYRNAANALLKLVDPSFTGFSADKFHNEFRDLMEIMGYPYIIRPSDFQSFGAQHRLAAALDPLYWIAEVVRIDENPEQQQPLEDVDEVQYSLFFFNFLRGAYERWLAEGDEPVETFEREMAGLFAKDSEKVELLHSQLETQLEEKRRELESLERSEGLRTTLNSEISRVDQKYRERETFLQKIQAEYDQSSATWNKLKEELAAARQRVQRANAQLTEARRELDQKGINTSQLSGILYQIQQIEQQTENEIQRQQAVLQDRRLILKSCQDEVSAIVELAEDVNRAFTSLGLTPEISVNPTGKTMLEIIGTDLKNMLEKVTKRRATIREMESAKQQLELDRSEIASQMHQIDQEMQELANELKSLNDTGSRDIRQLKKTHDTLVDQARERQRSLQTEKAQGEKKLRELEDYFKRYRDHVAQTLTQVVNEARALDESFDAM